jgi:hypothetical protein
MATGVIIMIDPGIMYVVFGLGCFAIGAVSVAVLAVLAKNRMGKFRSE